MKAGKPVTIDDLKQLVANIIHCCGHSTANLHNISEELATKLKQLSVANPELQSQLEQHLTDIESTVVSSPTTGSTSSDKDEDQFLKKALDVISEVQSMITIDSESHDSKILQSSWIYFIDSSGQPHFYNLLPLFIQGISVALYILRLSDRLDDYPLVEYYKNDKPIEEPFRSPLSTQDNFKISCSIDSVL